VQLEAISIGKDNKKTKVTVGDEKGEKHTIHFYNKTEKELKALATAKLDLFKYDGYKGTFKAFGQPSVVHGMEVNLEDDNYPERAGSYFVDGVTTTYGSGGFRRNVELGKKSA
jgi:phage protein D